MEVIPCFLAKDANRKIDALNELTDGEPRFEGLLINLKWTDTGMDHRVLTRKLIVCPMGRGYVCSIPHDRHIVCTCTDIYTYAIYTYIETEI